MEPKRWAILIGINRYHESIGSLKYCVNDCRRIERALKTGKDPFLAEHVLVLADDHPDGQSHPTFTTIHRKLKNSLSRMQEEDTVFLFFAGHGRVVDGDLRIVPSDANLATLHTTSIRTSHIIDYLVDCKARQKALVIDACHSGAGRDVSTMQRAALATLSRGEGLCTITSCGEGQLSHEWDEKEQGVFSYYLAKALEGHAADDSGRLTMDDIFGWVDLRVERWARKHDLEQRPWRYNVGGDVVLRGAMPALSPTLPPKPPKRPPKPEEPPDPALEAQARARNEVKQGDGLRKVGDLVTAAACYERALEHWPKFNEARLKLGRVLVALKGSEAGLPHFDEVISSDPDNRDARKIRGDTLMDLKEYKSAIDDYTQLVRMYSGFPNELAGAYYFRSRALFKDQKFELAVKDINQSIRYKPNEAKYFNRSGWIHFRGTGLFDKALSDFKEAVQLKPRFFQARLNLGVLLTKVNPPKYEEAQAVFSAIIDSDRAGPGLKAKAYFNRGNSFCGDHIVHIRRREGYIKAEEDYSKAIELNPDFCRAYRNRGKVRGSLGKVRDAADDADKAQNL